MGIPMDRLIELFETDDPDQMADRLMELIREMLESDRNGEGHIAEELMDEITVMVQTLTALI